MMSENEYVRAEKMARSLIRQERLSEAVAKMQAMVRGVKDGWEFVDKLHQVELSYGIMQQYMLDGVYDPEHERIYAAIQTDLLHILDRMHLRGLTMPYYNRLVQELTNLGEENTGLSTMMLRLETYSADLAVAELIGVLSERAMEIRRYHELQLHILFLLVLTNQGWTMQDHDECRQILYSEQIQINDKCLLVSAMTMSLLFCFDLSKLLLLMDLYANAPTQVSQRALVGMALACQAYHDRLSYYPKFVARLSLLNENEQFGRDMCRVQIQLLRCQETDKIDRRMRDEILPEMLKSMQAMRFNMDDEDGITENPEWQPDMESAMGSKLREMSELQQEGSDVYMYTFSNLKHFPFFKRMSNWFYPFDKQQSDVVTELNGKQNALLELILFSGTFCDSDKYSICFTLLHIPKNQRDAMIGQLSEEQLGEMLGDQQQRGKEDRDSHPATISNLYLHGLYRFFRLYPFKNEFYDPFGEQLTLYRYQILQPTLQKADLMAEIGEFLFRKERYTEAPAVLQSVMDLRGEGSAELYQKTGYCRQKAGDYEQAIEAYKMADMLRPDNLWTNRHLAFCYRQLQQYEQAMQYYLRVESVQPDNKSVMFAIGSCLVELGRYADALQWYFKLHFLDENNMKVCRAVSWCSFVTGKMEQALKFGDRIPEADRIAADWLNRGHVLSCTGQLREARQAYERSLQLSESKNEWLKQWHRDAKYLLDKGVKAEMLPLMADLVIASVNPA